MAGGMNFASMFRVDVVPESDFSSQVLKAFDSCPPTLEYDRDAKSYHDDLSEACRRGNLSAVKEGLPQSNVVLLDQLKKLAEVAATENDRKILSYLIQRKQTVSETENLLDSAAFNAAYCGHLQALTCLLDLEAVSDSAVDPTTGNSCLHIAAARNHRHIVEELCSRNPRLAKGKNETGLTPLHVAILNGNLELAQYFLKNGLCPPMIISRGGNTALHCACQNNQEHIAEFLITQVTTELLQAKNEKGFHPIHFAAAKGNLQLVRMLTDHMERCNIPSNSTGDSSWTPLHCAAEAGHLEVVKHYCSSHRFKRDACTTGCRKNVNPLHSAALHGKQPVLDYLLSSNKFPLDALCKIFVHSNALHLAAYRGHKSCCQLLIDEYNLNPTTCTGSGFTAIHLAAGSGKIETLQYLVKTKDHSPAVAGFNKITPLHVAAASGHADVVSWLLSTEKCKPNLPILMNKATPLHLAASAGSHECVKALLAHCNPNAKAILGVTPLYCATTEVICWELIMHGAVPTSRPDILDRYQFLQSWTPVLPLPRLFVVGASGAGKSTLVKALQLEHRRILGWFFAVDDVKPHTAGVIPVKFESLKFGRVIIYDFASHEEYYSNHEAILDRAGHSLPIFLLVVDVQQEAEEVKRQVSYWRNFIQQATHSSGNQSNIVLVGSHFDCLHTNSERASKQALLQAVNEDDDSQWVTIDCRMPASGSMTKIRNILQELCIEAKSSLPVLPRAHAFAAFLKHTFKNTTACQLHQIKDRIHAHGSPVTDFLEGLDEVIHNLSKAGSVLYLPDSNTPDDGWIILNQEDILQGIHGYQKQVKEMKLDTTSGLLSFQELEEVFKELLFPDMVVRYLVHMEICHEVDNQEILQALAKGNQQLDRRCFLFPDLIESDAPQRMWQEEGNFTCYSGSVFRCGSAEDFITPRFFHVLLLRIVSTFAANNSDVPLQDCSLWKNGIYWVKIGIQTIVELTEEGQALLILCRTEDRNKIDLIKHRAAVLGKIREVIQEFSAVSPDKLDNRHFIFSDLIEANPPQKMWQEDDNFTCYSGFVFRCRTPEDIITLQFFHVLLLRIVFTFASNNSDVPLQDCSLWKNGIYWVKIGIQTIVELTEGGRELLILFRSEDRNKMDLIKHRATVLGKVSEIIRDSPAVSLNKLIIHPQDLHPPHPIILSDRQTRVFRVQDLLQALLTAETPEQQYVRKHLEREGVRVAAAQCHIDDLLHFEPYSLIRGSQLKALIHMQHKGPIEEEWLFENIATYNKNKWKDVARVLKIGEERIQQNSQATDSCFMGILSEWLKTFSNKPTFKDLCEGLDQYSIFKGDNMETLL